MVIGVSADTVEDQRAFAEKNKLPFALLADEDLRVIRAYGAWGKTKWKDQEFEGVLRKTFLIDPQGVVVKEWPNVSVAGHAEEVLRSIP